MFDKVKTIGRLEASKKLRDEQLEKHDLIDLFWECTLSCNAKCKHCGSSAEGKKYPGELTTEEAKAAFRQIAEKFDTHKILINVGK